MKKVAFHANQLSLRGTEIALYQYAKYNEEILGNKSIICAHPSTDMSALPKFESRFEIFWGSWGEYKHYLVDNGFDFVYALKEGRKDGGLCKEVPTLVHAVFRYNEPHGHRYRYVSDWLAKDQGYSPETHSVPHICEPLPEPKVNFRKTNNISEKSTVFGYYGGSTEFNIPWVQEAVKSIVNSRDDIEFIFMNVNPFCNHSRVKFFPGSFDMEYKSAFVHACDAMLHARSGGETFGLAVSEFTLANKPVITYSGSGERSHLEILGERAITYSSMTEVLDILNNISDYNTRTDYYKAYDNFTPEIIMNKFNNLFLT